MINLIGKMTQLEMENDKTISIKITPCIIETAFMDPFPRDLKDLFLKTDAISIGFMIEDQDTVKYKRAIMRATNWLTLFTLGYQVEVTMDPFS